MGKTANEIKDQVSIVGLLSRLGFEPKKKSGKDFMYLSMLRESDTKPSFSVNDDLGVWYDHGSGEGGNVVDFGITYWKNLTFSEVLTKISEVYNLPEINHDSVQVPNRRKRLAVKLPNYKIEEIKALGNNQVITNYLKSRGVWDVANSQLREIYYHVTDEKQLKKNFFAVGWQNEKLGWVVRNKYFKGCLGNSAISFIQDHKEDLAIFEGYINYLTWRRYHPELQHSIIVLNSITNLEAAITLSSTFSNVELFFDHDAPGQKATKDFIAKNNIAIDKSLDYEGFNDLNEKLVAELKSKDVANLKQPFCSPRR